MKKIIAATAAAILAGSAITVAAPAANAAPVYTVKLSDYATPGQLDSLPGIHRALADVAAQGGGTIWVDGIYNIRNYINIDSVPRSKADGTPIAINWVGESSSSSGFRSAVQAPIFYQGDQTLRPEANGNPSSPLRGQYRYNWTWKNLFLEKTAGSSHGIFWFRTGAMVNARYESLNIKQGATNGNAEAFLMDRDHQAHGNLYTNLRIENRSNKSAFKVQSYGHFWNNNTVETSTVYNYNKTDAPCFEVRPAVGGNTTNTFRGITGQNCNGGFIHAYGQSGLTIQGSSNWDSPDASVYRDSIRIGKTSNGAASSSVALIGLGRVQESTGQRAMMAGRHLVAIGAGTTNVSTSGMSVPVTNTGLTY